MKANISLNNYPDASFFEEYFCLRGHQDWLEDRNEPAFGRLIYADSFIHRSNKSFCVDLQFVLYLEMHKSIYRPFISHMLARGWEHIDQDFDEVMCTSSCGVVTNVDLQLDLKDQHYPDLRERVDAKLNQNDFHKPESPF